VNLVYKGQLMGLGQTPVDTSIVESYNWLKQKCEDQFGAEFCQSILPEQPVWLPPTTETKIPWYAYLIAGFIIGKIL